MQSPSVPAQPVAVATPVAAEAHPVLDEAIERLRTPPIWLARACDPADVASALRDAAPEFASGAFDLVAVELKRLRLSPDGYHGICTLSVIAPAGDAHAIELQADVVPPDRLTAPRPTPLVPLGESGWSLALPQLGITLSPAPAGDEGLPSVHALIDPAPAAELLERALRGGTPRHPGFAIEACALEVMRYKPGSRCTVRYHLTLPPDQRERGWPQEVVGKTWHGAKGAAAYRGMRDLWGSPLATSRMVRIAEPLAFLPDENVLVQRAIAGARTLKQVLREPSSWRGAGMARLRRLIERTALGLAELHDCGVEATTSFSWATEHDELEERIARVDGLIDGFAKALAPAVAAVTRLGDVHPPEAQVPSHISFRPAQVLVDTDHTIGFIDFDGFCMAEPSVDLALFCVTVRDVTVRGFKAQGMTGGPRLFDQLDDLCEAFVAGYRAARPVSQARLAAWEALLRLNALVGFWTKAKLDDLDDRTELLRRHLRSVGAFS